MRQDLLDSINGFAKTLAKVSVWKTSKDIFGHLLADKQKNQKEAQSNYFYEFYCYLKIIDDLNNDKNHQIFFVKNNGIFPKGPSKKTNRPYFQLLDNNNNNAVYHIQSGTEIQTIIPDKTKSPDISFQKPTADQNLPSYKDVDIVYDAKYSDGIKLKSFSESQMSDFNKMIRYLKTKKAKKIILPYTQYSDFEGNCLITNKKSYTDKAMELKKEKMMVIEDFDIGKTFNVLK